MSGYVHCICRDCFEIAIAGPDEDTALCLECKEAGCEADGSAECSREVLGDELEEGTDAESSQSAR
jgi:hypothetical protein